MTYGFDRSQHLKSKIAIAELFTKGVNFTGYPVRIIAVPKNVKSPTQKTKLLISVPKKKCKLAVQRNFVKRRIIEAYRLNQQAINTFTQQHDITLNLGVIFTGQPEVTYAEIEMGVNKATKKLLAHLENTVNNESIKE